jgi:Schlafen, AlbA_2
MTGTPLGQFDMLTGAEIHKAIDAGLYESQYLDFKRECYGQSDSDKRDLLRDVVSMTNGGGGLLLVGVDEDPDEEGRARAVTAVADETERLYASCLSGIEDRIPGLAIRPIPVADGFVIALRCPRSFRGPHMITFKDENRFWVRHGKSNQRMTVREIRDAFSQSKSFETDVRSWITKRREMIRQRHGAAFLQVAVVPYGQVDDVLDVTDTEIYKLLSPPPMVDFYFQGSEEIRPTLAGLSAKGKWGVDKRWTIELERRGAICVVAHFPPHTKADDDFGVYLTIQSLVKYAMSVARLANALHACFALNGPFVLFLDLFVNVDISQLHPSLRDAFSGVQPEPEALVPEIVVPSLDAPDRVFRGMLDTLWNGFGRDRCPYFDGDGNPCFSGAGPS